MNNIITEANCIRINDTLIPKNSVRIVQILNGVRILFNTGVTQDLKVSESKIDGVDVASAEELFEFFKAQSFNVGGGSESQGAVNSVNNKNPDGNGNIILTPADIGAGTSNLAIGTTSTTALRGDTPLLQIGNTSTTAMAGDKQFATVEQGILAENSVSISDLNSALINKVDKVNGLGLSETSFTQSEKTKLSTIVEHYAGRFVSLTDLNAIVGEKGGYAYVSIDSAPTVLYAWNGQTSTWDSTVLAASEESPESIKTKYESNADTNVFSNAQKSKLDAIISDATKNDTDANLKNRANHTGTQAISTITDLTSIINAINSTNDSQTTAINGKEPSFAKGSIIQGENVTLTGNLTGRLVGIGDITINVSSGGGSDSLKAIKESPTYFTDYNASPNASIGFAAVGFSGGTLSYANNYNLRSGICIMNKTNTGGSGNSSILFGSLSTMIISGNEEYWTSIRPLQLASSATIIKCGFLDHSTSGTGPTYAAYIEYTSNTNNFSARTYNGGVSVTTGINMGNDFNPNKWYTLRVLVNNEASSILYEIYDDSMILLNSTTINTNIPIGITKLMTPGMFAWGGAGTTGAICHLDYQLVKMGYYPNR